MFSDMANMIKYLRPKIVVQKVGFELVGGKTKIIHTDRGSYMNKLSRKVPDDQSLKLLCWPLLADWLREKLFSLRRGSKL
jgi:hypothetical protein